MHMVIGAPRRASIKSGRLTKEIKKAGPSQERSARHRAVGEGSLSEGATVVRLLRVL